jgi:hypothetical protein
MGAKVDWDDKFRQYAKRKKWKFGRCPSEHIDTKDAIEKCKKTYGLRKIVPVKNSISWRPGSDSMHRQGAAASFG